MKIVIATESYSPTISGVAVFCRYLAQGMSERGHEVHVICPSINFHSYTERDGLVYVHRIHSRPNPFRQNHRNTIFAQRGIKKLLRQIKPDVIHLQDPLGTSKATLRAAKSLGVPVVITNHFAFDYILSYLPLLKPVHRQISWIIELYLKYVYNQCKMVTFPSNTIKNKFNHQKLKPSSVVISNGVDLAQFHPGLIDQNIKAKYSIPDKKILLHVGRLDQDKNAKMVIKAFLKLRKNYDVFLIVCGEGNRKEELIKMVQEAGESDNAKFIGFIDHKIDLPKIYQLADIFITGSNIETQGIVALEAMATGLPLVVPNAGALPELVKDGVNGYLFRPNRTNEMVEKIEKLIQNPQLAQKMGERGLEMVKEHRVDQSFTQFENIFKALTQHG